MINLYKHFISSIRWNALESISYQVLLLLHQVALYNVIEHSFYGLVGSIFSLIFLIVMIINFGFDVTLSPFFTMMHKSKTHFKKVMMVQLLPELAFLIIVSFMSLLLNSMFSYFVINAYTITYKLLILFIGIIFFESAKKTLRMILQLAFLNHKTAIIEIAAIVAYVGIVWLLYAFGLPFSIPLIFVPMFITSALSTFILSFYVYMYYLQLPDQSPELLSSSLHWRIVRSRFYNFLHQASHMAFSSNFLVPFFALTFGFDKAGIFKLISSIVYCVTLIIQKMFGLSSALILSHIKESTLKTKQEVFSYITNIMYQLLYGIIIFLIINYSTFLYLSNMPKGHLTLFIAYLFFIISFSENFFIAYEKFYISQEKTDQLLIFNLIVMALIAFIVWQSHHFSQLTILLAIIAIRIIAFSCIGLISFFYWQIKPSLKMNPLYFIGSVAFSIAFYIIARV